MIHSSTKLNSPTADCEDPLGFLHRRSLMSAFVCRFWKLSQNCNKKKSFATTAYFVYGLLCLSRGIKVKIYDLLDNIEPERHIRCCTSYCANLLGFSKSMSSLRGGKSWVASARQRKVSLPVPHSLILHISCSRRPGVSVTFVFPTRKY